MPFPAQDEARGMRLLEKEGRGDEYWSGLHEAIRTKAYKPEDFRIRELFEHFVDDGREAIASWSPRSGGPKSGVKLRESGVDTAAFANITGQIVYSKVLTAFNDPVFVAPRVTTTVPTEFDGEKIPGMGRTGDEAETVAEGHPYPLAGFGEEWINTPSIAKRGFIVPVTKEAIFFDRTGLILERARETAQWLAVNKEKRVLDMVLGITTSYSRNGAAAVAAYGDTSATHPFDNLAASNALADYTDVENAQLLFDALLDPNTGEPIIVNATQVICGTSLVMTARRVFNATQFEYVATHSTFSPNPLGTSAFDIVSNQYVASRLTAGSVATSTWYLGDFRNAFWYMENWPITSSEAPSNSELEFTHDIVARYKVSERGAPACIEPRRAVKSTA